jgi:hypothetical protein
MQVWSELVVPIEYPEDLGCCPGRVSGLVRCESLARRLGRWADGDTYAGPLGSARSRIAPHTADGDSTRYAWPLGSDQRDLSPTWGYAGPLGSHRQGMVSRSRRACV